MEPLHQTLTQVRSRITRYRGKDLNEQDTKAALIDPVLRALGWDLEGLEDVKREYKVKRRDKPVDYALFSNQKPVLFVEAKAHGQNLKDRKWANQIMGYATVAGVPWVVLTDGDEYQVYNALAPVPVDRKMFRRICITQCIEEAGDVLSHLAKVRMRQTDLEALWQTHFVDQEVRTVVEELLAPRVPDSALLALVRKRTKGLTARDVRASLARMTVKVDFSGVVPLPSDVTVKGLIEAGLIVPPLVLQKVYKKQRLSAKIDIDGRIAYGGVKYDSLSTAAGIARKSVIGATVGRKYPQTNGWTFWQFVDHDGRTKEIDELRRRYLGRKDLKVVGKSGADVERQGGR